MSYDEAESRAFCKALGLGEFYGKGDPETDALALGLGPSIFDHEDSNAEHSDVEQVVDESASGVDASLLSDNQRRKLVSTSVPVIPANDREPAYVRDVNDESIIQDIVNKRNDAFLNQHKPLMTSNPLLIKLLGLSEKEWQEKHNLYAGKLEQHKLILEDAIRQMEKYNEMGTDEDLDSRKRLEPLHAIQGLRKFPAPAKALQVNEELREELQKLEDEKESLERKAADVQTAQDPSTEVLREDLRKEKERSAALEKKIDELRSALGVLNSAVVTEFDLDQEAHSAVVLASITQVGLEFKSFRETALVDGRPHKRRS